MVWFYLIKIKYWGHWLIFSGFNWKSNETFLGILIDVTSKAWYISDPSAAMWTLGNLGFKVFLTRLWNLIFE